MQGPEIVCVSTHAQYISPEEPLEQWAEIVIRVPKGFNWTKTEPLLKKLQQATDLIGRGE